MTALLGGGVGGGGYAGVHPATPQLWRHRYVRSHWGTTEGNLYRPRGAGRDHGPECGRGERRPVTAGEGVTLPGQHLVTFEIAGHPASYSTAATATWKEAIRAAVTASGITPVPTARFAVGIEFRNPLPPTADYGSDLVNLIKPTLDALDGIVGPRQWTGSEQPAADRVDHLTASKRTVGVGEPSGATITVHVLDR